jgi:hypothetical protein
LQNILCQKQIEVEFQVPFDAIFGLPLWSFLFSNKQGVLDDWWFLFHAEKYR